MKKLLLLTSACLLVACNATDETSSPVNDPQNTAQTSTVNASDFNVASMDSLLSEAVNSGEVIGVSALVYDDGQIVYQDAFGLRDRERDLPVELDTVFRIYSMTKPITSVLIMDLVEEGELSLDDEAAKYIPELTHMKVAVIGEDGTISYEDQKAPITIEDLLLHRAGLGYGIYGPITPTEAAYEAAELFDPRENLAKKMEKLTELDLVYQPGDGWYYSYSIDVLGRIAEIVTGKKFGDLLQARVYEPLGMVDTGFYVRPDQKDRFATNYNRDTDGNFTVQDDSQTSYFNLPLPLEGGGGGLVSTLDDYRRFAQMMLQEGEFNGQRILEPETVRMMMTNQMDSDDAFYTDWVGPSNNTGFGYGGFVGLKPTPEQVADSGLAEGMWGWSGMAKTQFTINPKNGAFSIIMLQYFGADNAPIRDRFRALVTQEVAD